MTTTYQASSLDAPGQAEHGAVRHLAGKYMTFELAREAYGIEILAVREIIRLMQITHVPRAREFVRGVINLRGRVIPVIDLRLKFGMPAAEVTDQSVIIVLQCTIGDRQLTMGVLVDQVLEVLSIDAAQIEPAPCLGSGVADLDFVLGVAKAQDRVVFLLDIGRVLTEAERADLAATTSAAA